LLKNKQLVDSTSSAITGALAGMNRQLKTLDEGKLENKPLFFVLLA